MRVTHAGGSFDGPNGIYESKETGELFLLENKRIQLAARPDGIWSLYVYDISASENFFRKGTALFKDELKEWVYIGEL